MDLASQSCVDHHNTKAARTSANRQDRDEAAEPDHREHKTQRPQCPWFDALTVTGGDEHSWHIDCEKCHLVAVAVHTGDARRTTARTSGCQTRQLKSPVCSPSS